MKIVKQRIHKTMKKMLSVLRKVLSIIKRNKVIACIGGFIIFVITVFGSFFLELFIEKMEKFEPIVSFYEQELSQDVIYKVICSCYEENELPIIMDMPFIIQNQTHKSSEGLTLLFSYTDDVFPISDDKVVVQGFGINLENINRSVSTDMRNEFVGSTISLPDINPNETFAISDYVRVDNSAKAFTAMQIKISSKDMESCYYNLDFYFVNVPDEELPDYIESQLQIDFDKEDVFILFPDLSIGRYQGEEVYFLTHAAMTRIKPKK